MKKENKILINAKSSDTSITNIFLPSRRRRRRRYRNWKTVNSFECKL